jgi:hypothetical protein
MTNEPTLEPPAVAADDAPLTWDEYLEQRRTLDEQLMVLEGRWRTSQAFPRWLYHASEMPRIVASPAEQEALGAGWEVHPVEPATP